ncbi:MAG: hypothetical protein QE285_06520 [Aquabacterium sp.]|nr:hypothetical protein [Aquabacterium sp.]
MNKRLVPIFDSETAAVSGLQALHALHALHAAGDSTLDATGLLAKDAKGVVAPDIAAFKSEITALGAEASQASGAAMTQLQARAAATNKRMDGAMRRARQRVDALRQEADAKAGSLRLQRSQAKGDVKTRVEDRMQHVKSACHVRGARLSHAWNLTNNALTA